MAKTLDEGLDIGIRLEVDNNLATAILAALDADILREVRLQLLHQT